MAEGVATPQGGDSGSWAFLEQSQIPITDFPRLKGYAKLSPEGAQVAYELADTLNQSLELAALSLTTWDAEIAEREKKLLAKISFGVGASSYFFAELGCLTDDDLRSLIGKAKAFSQCLKSMRRDVEFTEEELDQYRRLEADLVTDFLHKLSRTIGESEAPPTDNVNVSVAGEMS